MEAGQGVVLLGKVKWKEMIDFLDGDRQCFLIGNCVLG